MSRFSEPPLAFLLIAYIALAALLAVMPLVTWGDKVVGLGIGLALGQVGVVAAWCGLGPGKLPARAIRAGLLAILSAMALARFLDPPPSMFLVVVIVVLVQWLVLQAPFWWLARYYRLRVAVPLRRPAGTSVWAARFGIRDLLVLTGAVAILLTVGRLLFLQQALQEWLGPGWRTVAAFFLLMVFSLLIVWSVVWASLLSRWSWLAAGFSLGLGAALTACELPVFIALLGPGGDANIFWWLNGGQLFALWGFLLLARKSGYRLVTGADDTAVPEPDPSVQD